MLKLRQGHDLTNIMAAESEDPEESKDQSVDESTSHEADTPDEDGTEGRDSDAGGRQMSRS